MYKAGVLFSRNVNFEQRLHGEAIPLALFLFFVGVNHETTNKKAQWFRPGWSPESPGSILLKMQQIVSRICCIRIPKGRALESVFLQKLRD